MGSSQTASWRLCGSGQERRLNFLWWGDERWELALWLPPREAKSLPEGKGWGPGMEVGLVGPWQPSQAESGGKWYKTVKRSFSLNMPQGWNEVSFSNVSEPALGFGKSGHLQL